MPRKQQFSAKQKKQQLQEKRKRKQNEPYKFGKDDIETEGRNEEGGTGVVVDNVEEQRMSIQPVGTAHDRVNKYALVFGGESKEELEASKRKSREPLKPFNEDLLISSLEMFSIPDNDLGMPRRGRWNYSMGKAKLEKQEQTEFREWIKKLDEFYSDLGRASYYERNIETWRQLWRTLEMSDVILFVCDVRYPTLHFSRTVYKYISEELEKPVILVLNKIDMVNPAVSVSWKRYFESSYPGLRVVLFSSCPDRQRVVENTGKRLLKRDVVRKQGWAYGADSLIQLAKVWYEDRTTKDLLTPTIDDLPKKGEDGFVTIGMIGQPNAGKSSLINGLLQDKKVSVSRTPGHTKHFQTIFYSEDIRLCDCPGLVFPTTAPKQLQIISGMFPVSQVREPYSIVQYVAERLDLVTYLRVEPPDEEDPWSAWYICYAWAEKHGFTTARTGRADVYRGANSILRLVVEGRLCVRLVPPNYTDTPIVGGYLELLSDLMKFATKEEEEAEEEGDQSFSEDEVSSEGEDEDTSGSGNAFSLLMKLDE